MPALGNFTQLQQVTLNLILNAADAMSDLPPSDRKIVVSTRVRENGFSEVAVMDNGPGISAEMKRKAFEPFVSSKSNGLGLVLAICRSIVAAHEGTLSAERNVGFGTTFTVTLPVQSVESQ